MLMAAKMVTVMVRRVVLKVVSPSAARDDVGYVFGGAVRISKRMLMI